MLNYYKIQHDTIAWLLMMYTQQTKRGIIPNDFSLAVEMTCYDCIWFEQDAVRREISALAILLFLDRDSYRIERKTFEKLAGYLHFAPDYPDTLDLSDEERAQMKQDLVTVQRVLEFYKTHPDKFK